MAYLGVSPSNGVRKVHTYTATASQTTFSGAGAENISLSYRDSTYIDVYQNGVKLGDADYTATSGTSVVLGTGATASDIVVIVVYDVFSVADTVSKADGGTFDGNVTMGGTLAVTGTTAFTGSVSGLDVNGTEIILDADADTSITSDTDDQIDFKCGGIDRVIIGADGSFTSQPASSGTIVFNEASNDVDFRVESNDNANMLFVDAGNNMVGIGTNNPVDLFSVKGTSGASTDINFSGADDTNDIRLFFGGDSSPFNGAIIYEPDTNNMHFKTSGSERVRITSGGLVGINTTNPTKALTIQGTASTLRLEDNTSGRYADIENSDGRMILRSDPDSVVASSRIVFEVDGTEGMRLESGKKLCVGNTDVGVHICRITGNSGGNAVLKVDNSATSGNTTCYLAFMDGSGGASVNSAFFQGFNGSNNFYLLGNGTHTFTSDENAKKNIETTRDGYLEDLAKLRVVKYNWKEQEDGEDKELGLIAQEVEKVFPKLVMNDIDPQIEEKDKKKMIKTTVLPFMLLKALQEANTKITTLEARITALEGE